MINAIEGGRIVADVDYKSMSAGMVVQPGDSVVLAKAYRKLSAGEAAGHQVRSKT